MKPKHIITSLLLLGVFVARAFADDSASLQFTVAAPDPVEAGEQVMLQTLVVNTGTTAWLKGTYYWSGEIYTIEGDERKFLAQTDSVSPPEDVPPGSAHGVQVPFIVPENLQGHRLLYRLFLVKDGRRLLETDYKGFQVIEKEFHPPQPQDFKVGGDVTLSYRNSSPDGWGHSQAVTAANLVGKVYDSSFLFNTYIVETYHKPITPTIILLNYYAPWGTLGIGDISPSLTPLSMDGQGMRGVSYERTKDQLSLTALIGRIVAPVDPGPSSGGTYARYSSGFKAGWQFTPEFKLSADAVLSRDDEHSIALSTTALTVRPQESLVYGLNAEWKFLRGFTFDSDYQLSAYKADLDSGNGSLSGSAWKQELKYKTPLLTARTALSRVTPDFYSFASPSVIQDRMTMDGEVGLFPADWTAFTLGYNQYSDNLDKTPAKATTQQKQATLGNMLRLFEKTTLNTSLSQTTVKGTPASVQNNRTNAVNFSVTQPFGAQTLTAGWQTTRFTDYTGLSHGLRTDLISLNGAFRLNRQMFLSTGLVNTVTKDQVDFSTGRNTSVTANLSYSLPRRPLAFQLWATLSSVKNDSLTAPADNSSLSLNLETVWMKSRASRFTFGIGTLSKKDDLGASAGTTELNVLTRYNYSF